MGCRTDVLPALPRAPPLCRGTARFVADLPLQPNTLFAMPILADRVAMLQRGNAQRNCRGSRAYCTSSSWEQNGTLMKYLWNTYVMPKADVGSTALMMALLWWGHVEIHLQLVLCCAKALMQVSAWRSQALGKDATNMKVMRMKDQRQNKTNKHELRSS